MSEIKKLTPEGLKKLKDELKELKEVKRKQITERIQEAKEHGDLSENAEYHEAREEQSFIEGRILELENIIKNSLVMNDNVINSEPVVKIGSVVKAECEGSLNEYKIVGSTEADPKNNLISCDSPLGQAFLGKKIKDHIKVSVPRGDLEFIIKEIN